MNYIQKSEENFKNISITLKFPQNKQKGKRGGLRGSSFDMRRSTEMGDIKYAACFSTKVNMSTDIGYSIKKLAYNPFVTLDEVKRKEEVEKKKLWINSKGFI